MEIECDLLEGAWRAAQIVFVCHAECGADVDIGVFDRDLIQGRKLRQLGEQSKGGAGDDVLERGRGKVVPPTLGWLVRLDLEPTDAADHVHVLVDMRHGPLSQHWNLARVLSRRVVRPFHPFEVDPGYFLVHLDPP